MMTPFWTMVARFLAQPTVTAWLIRRAMRTPYVHITGPDGSVYMERYWLFNPYPQESAGHRPWWQFPISVRLHHILRKDDDGHLHDHPWNARTVILRGTYGEIRLVRPYRALWDFTLCERGYERKAGNTAVLRFGEFHRITQVSDGGVWTMFITGRKRGTWGFLVEGAKIPWREYLGMEQKP